MTEPDAVQEADLLTTKEPYVAVCRHCTKLEEEHILGQCLFDSTRWDPMSEHEFGIWVLRSALDRIRREWSGVGLPAFNRMVDALMAKK